MTIRSANLSKQILKRYLTIPSTQTSIRPKQNKVPVDSLCIPISPPYSIQSYIPIAKPLSRTTLLKLYKLAALVPPKTEESWKELEELGGLIAIMEGVRLVDTSFIQSNEGQYVDGRVREKALDIVLDLKGKKVEEVLEVSGDELLKLAQVTDGRYFVVRTPEGIRGKKKASNRQMVEEE